MEDNEEVELLPLHVGRAATLGFMASLYVLTKDLRNAENCVIELMAWAAFSPNRPRAQA